MSAPQMRSEQTPHPVQANSAYSFKNDHATGPIKAICRLFDTTALRIHKSRISLDRPSPNGVTLRVTNLPSSRCKRCPEQAKVMRYLTRLMYKRKPETLNNASTATNPSNGN